MAKRLYYPPSKETTHDLYYSFGHFAITGDPRNLQSPDDSQSKSIVTIILPPSVKVGSHLSNYISLGSIALSGRVKNVFDAWIGIKRNDKWEKLWIPDGYYPSMDRIKKAMQGVDRENLLEITVYGAEKEGRRNPPLLPHEYYNWRTRSIKIAIRSATVTHFSLSPTLSNICGFGKFTIPYSIVQYGMFQTYANVKHLYLMLPGCVKSHYVNGIAKPILGLLSCTFDDNRLQEHTVMSSSVCQLLPYIDTLTCTINSAIFPDYVIKMMSLRVLMKLKLDVKENKE